MMSHTWKDTNCDTVCDANKPTEHSLYPTLSAESLVTMLRFGCLEIVHLSPKAFSSTVVQEMREIQKKPTKQTPPPPKNPSLPSLAGSELKILKQSMLHRKSCQSLFVLYC